MVLASKAFITLAMLLWQAACLVVTSCKQIHLGENPVIRRATDWTILSFFALLFNLSVLVLKGAKKV